MIHSKPGPPKGGGLCFASRWQINHSLFARLMRLSKGGRATGTGITGCQTMVVDGEYSHSQCAEKHTDHGTERPRRWAEKSFRASRMHPSRPHNRKKAQARPMMIYNVCPASYHLTPVIRVTCNRGKVSTIFIQILSCILLKRR